MFEMLSIVIVKYGSCLCFTSKGLIMKGSIPYC